MPDLRLSAQDRISAQQATIRNSYETRRKDRQEEVHGNSTSNRISARQSQQDAARRLNWKSENPETVISTHLNGLIRDQKDDMPPVDARFNMTVALLKDGKIPEIFDPQKWDGPADKDFFKKVFTDYANDARTYTACHDVASELVNIFGDDDPDQGQVISGKGDDRAQGIKAAQDALKPNQPSVIQVKHKDDGLDGHSFVLFNTGNKDNKIQSIEAWAVDTSGDPPPMSHRADLFAQMSRGMKNIDVKDATAALDDLSSANPDARDRGLKVLSKAGGRAAFEAPQQDYNTLETTISIKPLATPNEVQERFRERHNTFNQMFSDLQNAFSGPQNA